MGSFDLTCCISGLPIRGGDAVMYLLLTENPYAEGRGAGCYITDRWFPRTLPLRATYNDYGSVEDVEAGPMQEVWLKALEVDLDEVGVGDNAYHDVATWRGMSFDHMLEAVLEGRLRVRREVGIVSNADIADKLGMPDSTPAGVPSLRRVAALIQAGGLNLSRADQAVGYLVDEPTYGCVRVRYNYGDCGEGGEARAADLREKLEAALRAVGSGYASALWAQAHDSSYHGPGELVFRPHLGTPQFYGDGVRKNDRYLQVVQGLVRMDVWEALISTKLGCWWGGPEKTLKQYRAGVRAGWEAVKKEADPMLKKLAWMRDGRFMDLTGWAYLASDPVPFTVGPSAHARLLMDWPGLDEETFLARAAEASFVHAQLSALHRFYRPSEVAGQGGDMVPHARFHAAMSTIAKNIADADAAERAKYK